MNKENWKRLKFDDHPCHLNSKSTTFWTPSKVQKFEVKLLKVH